MKIAFLFNQKPVGATLADDDYAEWDDAETIQAVSAALQSQHQVIELDCHPDRLPDIIGRLQAEQPDLCFNMAEGAGTGSREAQIPALLDMLGLRYTASDPLTLSIALDKAWTKKILTSHQIPTPDYRVISSVAELAGGIGLDFPMIVKPVHEGSSKGIYERSVVENPEQLERQVAEVLADYRQPALVENFLPGREFTVALMGNGPEVEVLPLAEVLFDDLPSESRSFYSYEAKWIWFDPNASIDMLRCPAEIAMDLREEIEEISRRTFDALRCRDWSRIDVRLDKKGLPQILEINPLPGILPDPKEQSAFPAAANAGGLSYEEMILRVVDEATTRYGLAADGRSNTLSKR